MKKASILLVLLSFLSLNTYAQVPDIEWQKCMGGNNYDASLSIQQTVDGGYIIAGYSESNSGDVSGHHGYYDYWIVKTDDLGNITWQKSLGGNDDDIATSIIQTQDRGYIVAGYSKSNDGDVNGNHGSEDCWIVKLDSNGTITWQKSFGGSDVDQAFSIQQTPDGGYIVAGVSGSNDGDVSGNNGSSDAWIIKLDASGTITWQNCLGGSGDDYARSIQQTQAGGYIVAGYSNSNNGDVTGNHGSFDYWIVKLDASGSITWQKSLGGGDDDYATSIQQTPDGGYIVAGISGSNDGDVSGNNGYDDIWLIKLDISGNLIWQKCVGGFNYDITHSVDQTSDGGYILAGTYTGSEEKWRIVKLDSNGAITSQKFLGGSDDDEAYTIIQTHDGGYIIAGSTTSNDGDVTGNHGMADYWIVKLEGFPASTKTIDQKGSFSIYPNPAQDLLYVEINNFANHPTTAYQLLDISGKIVLQGTINAQKETISLKNLAEGVYVLKVGESVQKVFRVGN